MAIEGAAVEEALRFVLADQVEDLVGRHSNAFNERLVNAIDDGLSALRTGVLVDAGSDERHTTISQ